MKNFIFGLLAISLLSCGQRQAQKTAFKGNPKLVEKDIPEFLSEVDYHSIFDQDSIEGIPIYRLEIGDLKVTSGQIVACDPLVSPDMPPLLRTIAPGRYPLEIYVAKTPQAGDRYALVNLKVSDKQARKWVLALRAGQDITELTEEGAYFGFSVDAGIGGLFDYEAGKAYQAFEEKFGLENPGANVYDDYLAAEFKTNAKDQDDPNDAGDWINIKIPGSDLNMSMFSSGYGDGLYPAYWGIDEHGEVTDLVIDFLVLFSTKE